MMLAALRANLAPGAILERAFAPVDAAALSAWRVLMGLLFAAIPARFVSMGWIDRFYVRPTYLFPFWGFEWLPRPDASVLTACFEILVIAGLCVACGFLYRVASAIYFLIFSYIELLDVTTYLNHYYLVGLLALLMTALPLHRHFSLDAWLWPSRRRATHPAFFTWLLRAQVATVYFHAALAKVSVDWLLYGQPLGIWLGARADLPGIGLLGAQPWAGLAMSWAGFLYDLTIVLWLSWRRTRALAYVLVLSFHAMTRVLFDIGMFPFIMSIATLVFWDPSWPRRFARAQPNLAVPSSAPKRVFPLALAGVWALVQLVLPLRASAYGGNVLWHEQGMRWSWRVMCREKNGSVTYRVRAPGWPREQYVSPRRYLTRDQEDEFATQPDMILRLAHHIRDEYLRDGERVEVRVDALVSLNGRPMEPLIDPDVDLAQVPDTLGIASWITEGPLGPPPRDMHR
jgi:vitamin K-dependent gamma-carboxylase